MNKYNLYIGANNITGICEVNKVCTIINKYHEGYTITNTQGYWQGKAEESVIVTIFADSVSDKLIQELKQELQQDCIIVEGITSVINFI